MPTEVVRLPEEWTDTRAPRTPALTPRPRLLTFSLTPGPSLTLFRNRKLPILLDLLVPSGYATLRSGTQMSSIRFLGRCVATSNSNA